MADLIFKCIAKRIAFVPRYALLADCTAEILMRFTTRMHSSMMCTVRCSGRLWAWGCLTGMSAQAGCLPGGACLPRGCLPGEVGGGMSA